MVQSKPLIERNLIGCLCVAPVETFFAIEQKGITDQSFTDQHNRFAYRVAADILREGQTTLDENTLASALQERGMEDAEGYCRTAFEHGQNLTAIDTYAELVRKAELRRIFGRIGGELIDLADNPDKSVIDIKSQIEMQLLSLCTQQNTTTWADAAEIRVQMWSEAARVALEGGQPVIGVPFRDESINRLTGGARKGRLTVVAAPRKAGKTIWWGSNAVWQARQGIPVGCWCGEMTQDEVIGRNAASDCGVSSFHMDTGLKDRRTVDIVAAACREVGKLPITMSDDPMSIEQLCSWVRRAIAKDGIQIMYIDHLDLIGGRGSPYERISENTKSLRVLALQTGIPIVLLHQLNRQFENERREPESQDLRDSGKVAENAYSVSIFYQDRFSKEYCDDTKVVWRVVFNRGGPTGWCLFHRNFDTQSMDECSREEMRIWEMQKKGLLEPVTASQDEL